MKMKKTLTIALAALLLAGCSNTAKDDPFLKATRDYAAKEMKEHYNTDVDPNEIQISLCDYSLPTPLKFQAINNSLTKNENDYKAGRITKEEYTDEKVSLLEEYEHILECWVYADLDPNVRDTTDKHRLYYCVVPVLDTAKFYVRWSSYDPNDTHEMFSAMDMLQLYWGLQTATPLNFYDEGLEYRHYNDRGSIYNARLNKWYRTQEELEEDLKRLGYE